MHLGRKLKGWVDGRDWGMNGMHICMYEVKGCAIDGTNRSWSW